MRRARSPAVYAPVVRGRDLLHPLPLSAVALLALNDHLLKASSWAPRALTGKLSDFAGLFFFPILLVAMGRVARPTARTAPLAIGAAALTALVFAAIKIEPHANALAARALGSCARDATDLVALPMTALGALWCVLRQRAEEGRRWARSAAMLVAALASVATSRAYRPPCPVAPTGEAHRSWDALCARTPGATVSIDGSRVSVTLDVTPNGPGCLLRSRGFAVDQHLRPGLTARTTLPPPGGAIDQLTRWRLQADLPYAATCDTLRLGLLIDVAGERDPYSAPHASPGVKDVQAIADVPILSCGPKEAP